MRRLLETARYEVLPTASVEEKVLAHVPVGRPLTVTASATKGQAATLDLAVRLAGDGYRVVPHLAARMVSGRTELTEIVERLVGAGIESVFVPAGDAPQPAGDYTGSLDLLRDLSALGSPFTQVGVAGYPESHPLIQDDAAIQALTDKRDYATNVVSNVCFDPNVVAAWVGRLRRRGNAMPLFVGIPGPVERAKLLAMATKVGVGESTRFLTKNKSLFARIALPGGFRPERFLDRLEPTLGDPTSRIQGLHVYTFNQIAETEAWRRECLDRAAAPVMAG